MYSKTQEQNMELEAIYESDEDITGPRTLSYSKAKGKAQECSGSRRLVLISVGLGLICVLLLVFIILHHNTITAERDQIKSYKKMVEQFNQTINSLQDNHTDLTQNNLVLETKVKDLTAEKNQLQRDFDSLGQKNQELRSKVRSLSTDLKRNFCKGGNQSSIDGLFISKKAMSWSDTRQYCKDRAADLVIINTEEKQILISSLLNERLWIGLSDTENEGNLTWVDNSTLKKGFWKEGEPNDEHGVEDCVEIRADFPFILNNWNDLPCSERRKGICEK
ncbi:CD209 antigen-like protein B [Carassius carassius]|uniref:CD209 antigen-like protein B n=1 Tax=Carassius carassius TaxID=217509 RepID=UPI0028697315|nr:CD209 antigen-like protein B [Carassius carassius]